MGKASFAELKMLKDVFRCMFREMIFRLMKKTMYNVVSKTVDIGDFIGVRAFFKKQVGEISVHVYGFWQSLETASVKTDADGKTMMHLPIRNNVTAVVM
jgi:lysyl-tRNA synthetase class II